MTAPRNDPPDAQSRVLPAATAHWRIGLRYAGRGLLIAAVLYCGYVTWQLVSEWREIAAMRPPYEEPGDSTAFDWNALLTGDWQVEGLPFRVATSTTDAQQLALRMQAPPKEKSLPGIEAALSQLALTALKNQGAKSDPVDNFRRYELGRSEWRVTAFTIGNEAAERLVLLRAAIAHKSNESAEPQWSFYEARAMPAPVVHPTAEPHWPSVGTHATILATRFDQSEKEIGRLVSVPGTVDLPQLCSADGWTASPLGANLGPAVRAWTLRRRSAACVVLDLGGANQAQSIYLLVAAP